MAILLWHVRGVQIFFRLNKYKDFEFLTASGIKFHITCYKPITKNVINAKSNDRNVTLLKNPTMKLYQQNITQFVIFWFLPYSEPSGVYLGKTLKSIFRAFLSYRNQKQVIMNRIHLGDYPFIIYIRSLKNQHSLPPDTQTYVCA